MLGPDLAAVGRLVPQSRQRDPGTRVHIGRAGLILGERVVRTPLPQRDDEVKEPLALGGKHVFPIRRAAGLDAIAATVAYAYAGWAATSIAGAMFVVAALIVWVGDRLS